MALPSQSTLRGELVALLGARVELTQEQACQLLAQRLRPAGGEAARDADEPMAFRRAVFEAADALLRDGVAELRSDAGGGLRWRIVSLRDAAELPEEISPSSAPYYSEALSVVVRANKYEKDRHARKRCIDHYGARCVVCDFDFEKTYGVLGRGCVRMHHIVPLAQIHAGYEFDAVRDLRPVCGNCHYMIHRVEPAYDIEQLRSLLRRQAQDASMPSASLRPEN